MTKAKEIGILKERIAKLREGLEEMAEGATSNAMEPEFGFMDDAKKLLEEDNKYEST